MRACACAHAAPTRSAPQAGHQQGAMQRQHGVLPILDSYQTHASPEQEGLLAVPRQLPPCGGHESSLHMRSCPRRSPKAPCCSSGFWPLRGAGVHAKASLGDAHHVQQHALVLGRQPALPRLRVRCIPARRRQVFGPGVRLCIAVQYPQQLRHDGRQCREIGRTAPRCSAPWTRAAALRRRSAHLCPSPAPQTCRGRGIPGTHSRGPC